MGSRDLGGHYDRLPGGEFDDIGANPAGLFARVDVLSSPSRHVTSVTRFPLFPVSSSRMSRWTLTPTSPSLPVAHRASFFSRSILIVSRAAAAGGADDHAGQPRSASAYADPGTGERLVAMCPKCSSQLFPPACPRWRAGQAGHLAGDQRQYDNASARRARARAGERRGADGEVSALRGAAPATPRGEPRDLRRVPSGDWDARRAGTAAKPRVRAAGTIAAKQPTAHHFMPRVLSAAAAAAGRAARGLRRMQAGDAGARG